MNYPFLPVSPCCTDVVINTPCGCSSTITNSGCSTNNLCSTNLTASSTIVYDGPVLSCIIAEPCDTLNVVLQKIDEVICNLLGEINTLNIQVTNITNQITFINSEIININNTLDECCVTTTSTTTLCPCTTYGYVGPRINPGTITYVECDTLEPITDTASSTVSFACVDNNYPIIEIGSINVIDTQDCCSNTTTTTTTTIPINPFCYEVTAVNRCTVYWTDANGNPQSQNLTDGTINICADEDSIASSCGAGGGISITGGTVVCTNDTMCQPTTTTTTTTIACNCITFNNTDGSIIDHTIGYNDCIGEFVETTISASEILQFCGSDGIADSELVIVTTGGACIAEVCPTTTTTTTVAPLACVSYVLQSTGAGEASNQWEAFACNSNISVSGIIPFPGTMETGCITEGSLLLGANLEVVSDAPCEGVSCEAFEIQGLSPVGSWDAIDCSGNRVGEVAPSGGTVPTGCIIPNTLILDNAYIKDYLGPCGSTTTTTSSSSTTTSTTTSAPTSFRYFFSNAALSGTLACAQVTFPIVLYSDDATLNLGSFLYTDMALTTPFPGAARWYQESVSGISYAILNNGEIAGEFTCAPTTTTTTTTLFPPTTTTTTTVVNFSHGLSAGEASNVIACLETVAAITVYTSVPTIVFGTVVYTDPALTTTFIGGGASVYYKNFSVGNCIRINSSGQVFTTFSC